MMKRGLGLTLSLMALSLVVPFIYGASVEDSVAEAFRAIAEAEAAGGDVDALIEDLNRAIVLIHEGGEANVATAEQVLHQVVLDAEAVRSAGVQQGNMDAAVAILKVALLLGAAALAWVHGDEWFWRLWLRTKRGYVVQ